MSAATPAASGTPNTFSAARVAEGFAFPMGGPTLDRADLRAIGLSFGFAVGLVLAAALACDAYLLALLRSAPVSNDAVAGRQLALDLLPWTASFTVMASIGLAPASWLCRKLDRGPGVRQAATPVPLRGTSLIDQRRRPDLRPIPSE